VPLPPTHFGEHSISGPVGLGAWRRRYVVELVEAMS
jgi:hypothetical protein